MLALLRLLAQINTVLLRVSRQIAWVALGLMVLVILAQVFFRYVLNAALAWPEEAARFLMLWMTALMAPSAFRWGGFVAIDMVPAALPRAFGQSLTLALYIVCLIVIVVALTYGWSHSMGFGGRFNSSSLRIPLDWFGGEMVRVKLRYMYGSLLIGMAMLLLVNIELVLRSVMSLVRPDAELPSLDQIAASNPEAE